MLDSRNIVQDWWKSNALERFSKLNLLKIKCSWHWKMLDIIEWTFIWMQFLLQLSWKSSLKLEKTSAIQSFLQLSCGPFLSSLFALPVVLKILLKHNKLKIWRVLFLLLLLLLMLLFLQYYFDCLLFWFLISICRNLFFGYNRCNK